MLQPTGKTFQQHADAQVRLKAATSMVLMLTCNTESYDLPISTLAALQAIADW